MTPPSASGSASRAASRRFRPRPALWWRSALAGLLIYAVLGSIVLEVGKNHLVVAAGVLSAGALGGLYFLARQLRKASLTLSPKGLLLGVGATQRGSFGGVLMTRDDGDVAGTVLPWDDLRLRGILGRGRQAVLELVTRRLGLFVPGEAYDLPALERSLRDFGVREAAAGSPEASWPDEALLRQEATDRLARLDRPLRAGMGCCGGFCG